MMEAILVNLNIAGLVLAIFFISLILSKKGKQLRDYLLAFFIFLLGTFLLIKYMFQFDLFNSYPIIIYLDICYWVLLGPTLYIYTLVSSKGENHLRINYVYTLIPALLVVICFSEFIFGNPTGLFNSPRGEFSLIVEIGFAIWLYNSPIFYFLTIMAIRKHQKQIKNHFSFSKSIDLKWLNYLTHGFGLFIILLVFRELIEYIINWSFPFGNYGISLGVVFIYIFGIGFYGYKQGGIFDAYLVEEKQSIKQLLPNAGLATAKSHLSYKKSGLNEDEAQAILDKLKSLMHSEQPYLESELHLAGLAVMVDVSKHNLSQAINEYLNKNFFDFINEYRIEYIKGLLSDQASNQYKIVSLAYDSGFSSKSTFYKIFKKSEGMTPAEYRLSRQCKAM